MAKLDSVIRWFMPREEHFSEFFRQDTANLVAAAKLFHDIAKSTSLEERRVQIVALKAIEHDGDQITRRIFEALNATFLTPLDREDIRALASDLDDALDHLESVARSLVLFELSDAPPALVQFAEILVEMVVHMDTITHLLWDLKHARRIGEATVLISDLENRADELYQTVIVDLFRSRREPIEILKWKGIYDELENACDQCKEFTHVVGNIVAKNT